ncbi:hypothetical protein GF342_02990 [Candidatus Woesearchaeota archaeon]|nr:hypothetical protein [Candidatus Woesearchaeota archaeon]
MSLIDKLGDVKGLIDIPEDNKRKITYVPHLLTTSVPPTPFVGETDLIKVGLLVVEATFHSGNWLPNFHNYAAGMFTDQEDAVTGVGPSGRLSLVKGPCKDREIVGRWHYNKLSIYINGRCLGRN